MNFFRYFYNGLLRCVVPFVVLRYLWRSKKNKAYRQHFAERFGFVARQPENAKIIWVHAVSVGETIAIRSLIEALLQQYPDHKIWVTNGTINGRARTMALFSGRVLNSYAPYDLPSATARFIQRIRPVMTLIMETEIWPNWMRLLQKNNIPVILVNARLSEKSYRQYKKYQLLFNHAWQGFSLIAAQAEADAVRYEQLGVSPQRLSIAGNLKYHLLLPENLSAQIEAWKPFLPDAPTWITASIHPGELPKLFETFALLKKTYPALFWILVPRHPERAEAMKKACEAEGWSVTLRSQLGKSPSAAIHTDILLVDVIGELFLFYALAQVAFVGGSFIDHGGHNILEPAAVGAVITCGTSMYNFAAMLTQFQAAQAILVCADAKSLASETAKLFADSVLRAQYIQAAQGCFTQHEKVLQTYLSLIQPFL
jgi:3-deoxy-D-manno-octulosonic-acid transferase